MTKKDELTATRALLIALKKNGTKGIQEPERYGKPGSLGVKARRRKRKAQRVARKITRKKAR